MSEPVVTEADREKAALVTGCRLDDTFPEHPFCAEHEEDGNPPWHRCRWAPIAAALAEEREKARLPFLALAEELERHADLQRHSLGGPTEVVLRWQSFHDAAANIRRAAEETA